MLDGFLALPITTGFESGIPSFLNFVINFFVPFALLLLRECCTI